MGRSKETEQSGRTPIGKRTRKAQDEGAVRPREAARSCGAGGRGFPGAGDPSGDHEDTFRTLFAQGRTFWYWNKHVGSGQPARSGDKQTPRLQNFRHKLLSPTGDKRLGVPEINFSKLVQTL